MATTERPAGYKTVLYGVLEFYACDDCGATVAPESAETHTAWHQSLADTLAAIGRTARQGADGAQMFKPLGQAIMVQAPITLSAPPPVPERPKSPPDPIKAGYLYAPGTK